MHRCRYRFQSTAPQERGPPPVDAACLKHGKVRGSMGSLRTCTVYVVAFMLGDLLRMAVWPAFSDKISFPTAIPKFFSSLKYMVVWTSELHLLQILVMWGLFWFFHALSLFCSVWIGRWGWLPVTVVFFGFMALFIQTNYQGEYLEVFYLMAVVLMIAAYWLFCHFPKYKLFHFKD